MGSKSDSNLGDYVGYAASVMLAGVVRVHGPVLFRKGYQKLSKALKPKKEKSDDGKQQPE